METERPFKKEWHILHDPLTLLRAVIRSADAIDLQRPGGHSAGAEIYTTNRNYFLEHARPVILKDWCEQTHRHPEECPWTDDSLVYTWTAWRKVLAEKGHAVRQILGLEPDLFGESA